MSGLLSTEWRLGDAADVRWMWQYLGDRLGTIFVDGVVHRLLAHGEGWDFCAD